VNAEELKVTLSDFGTVEVEEDRGRFVAHVISSQFEGMDEGDRQYQVWERARQRFGLQASVDIEFMFTYSPTEWDEFERARSSVA
jgi:acid stress-induced BolA-like protein IbaG/YrbA